MTNTINQVAVEELIRLAAEDGCTNPDSSVFTAIAHVQRRLALVRELEQHNADVVMAAENRVSQAAFTEDGWLAGAAS